MKHIPLLLLSTILLAGCATTQRGVEVRTVEVPTPVPCVKKEDIPDEPKQVSDRLTGNKETDFPIVAASALELRAALKTSRAALIACAE